MHERTKRLHALMETRNITVGEACRLLDRRPVTLYQWRCGVPYVIPAHQLQLLELLTAPRKAHRARV